MSPAAVWERRRGKKERGIFSGLFGIIEVRPSAGVCVSGALVLQREEKEEWGGRRGWKEREKRFGPRAGLVPIRPEARALHRERLRSRTVIYGGQNFAETFPGIRGCSEGAAGRGSPGVLAEDGVKGQEWSG
ncbi:unnamed protein product [Pleuronectes platessa]|uniref:Uncharacterized protein n=1 Tax=Pleuronectes platessa TaxID=8262 RepID=A0A9N7VS00_PLEPL|nr:unnamed protein product [Pleuronectes platessa]